MAPAKVAGKNSGPIPTRKAGSRGATWRSSSPYARQRQGKTRTGLHEEYGSYPLTSQLVQKPPDRQTKRRQPRPNAPCPAHYLSPLDWRIISHRSRARLTTTATHLTICHDLRPRVILTTGSALRSSSRACVSVPSVSAEHTVESSPNQYRMRFLAFFTDTLPGYCYIV